MRFMYLKVIEGQLCAVPILLKIQHIGKMLEIVVKLPVAKTGVNSS